MNPAKPSDPARPRRALLLLALLALTGCAAPANAPRADAGLPVPAATGSPLAPDRSCRSDADCVVKDVGNCCGAMPACVNRASAADPAAVMAQCRAAGRMDVCGFTEIAGCSCVQGQCRAQPARADPAVSGS